MVIWLTPTPQLSTWFMDDPSRVYSKLISHIHVNIAELASVWQSHLAILHIWTKEFKFSHSQFKRPPIFEKVSK